MPVTIAPLALMAALVFHPVPECTPMQDHACLGQRKRHEHPDHVERNECVSVAAKGDEQDGGERAETKNAIRERQPVALVHELTRKIAIAR